MVDKIEIKLIDYELIIESNICYINNKTIPLKEEDIDNIIRIIRNWNNNYTNKKVIGENNDYIYIYKNNKKYSYTFKNEYPKDIDNLTSYIGDMYAR